MPIRINLLAEAQAAEDLRRRDPVKRVIIGSVLILAGMLVWYSGLQLKVIMANRELGQAEFQVDSDTNTYQATLNTSAQASAAQLKISELGKLTNSRMLQGNLLEALQHVSVDNVQLTHLEVQQSYANKVNAGKVTSVTEKIVVTMDAKDSSPNPGDQVGNFKSALAAQPYFKQMLDQTNGIRLVDESPPQTDVEGKDYVLFTLECHFPDVTR